MSTHPFALAPNSKKPYIGISYYAYQQWLDIIDEDRLTKWERLRFKLMNERYTFGRGALQIPVIALSYYLAHLATGYPIRRRDGGFRDNLIFGTFFYVLIHHHLDQRRVSDRFLDELFTQSDPDGQYLRTLTKQYYPVLWDDIKDQMLRKGVKFEEPTIEFYEYPIDETTKTLGLVNLE